MNATKYTAEEVLVQADHVETHDHRTTAAQMLRAYAERIKADESAVPPEDASKWDEGDSYDAGWNNGTMMGWNACRATMLDRISASPPAQAAQK